MTGRNFGHLFFFCDTIHRSLGGCYDIAKRNKGQPKLTINGVSRKFKRMCEIYRVFAKDWEHCSTWTDDDLIKLYNHESFGEPLNPGNGFALGKKWLNVTVAMWLEDIELGTLFKHELYEDGKFPHWWLDKVLK